ncbi:unnamed protein product [Mytilus edulis]|uniref:COR domain-containing protein n=1 Tax=Mytilus edulis TaxID=6550 RepID=A0A8S3RQB6_MYTED|nr:unnamed protein product [Mytilus edulis]
MTDKRSVELYLTLLESGSEKKRDIRLVVVGKKGAGKTSLIKRLFGEDNTDVTSTNGIEIHKIKCKAKSNDGIWNKLDGNYEETETHARLLKEYEEKLQNKGTIEEPVESNIAIKDKTPATSFDESKKSGTVYKQPKIITSLVTTESQVEPPVTTESQVEPPVTTESQAEPPVTSQQPNQSLEQAKRILKPCLNLMLIYMTKRNAIYLVVTKLNEAGDKEAQDLFQLWMDSIHCYSRLEEDGHRSDVNEKTSDDLDPPIVIVGTWKDALISDVQEIDDACSESILKYTENMSEDELRHIRQEYFISNTEDDPSVFQQIRENILNLARKMKTWNKDYPLKFIQLETRLQEKKKELPIISFQEIQNIASDTPKPLNDEELRLFLEFHHEIRALVYFKDLPSYIILDTQWLSDAFRCIVTAKKFRAISIKNRKKWDVFYSRGKLYNEVLEDIFKKENNFSKHKDHILNVMEKFDIIIRPNLSDGDAADETPCYYVPCIIKAEPEYDIYEMFNVTENTCTKSTWLCYKFRFLPPHLMNHLIASLCRKYTVAEFVTKEQKRQIALFRGSAVFELQKTTKLTKLHVMKCPNWIQIQVWQFGKEREGGLFKFIDEFVTEEIVKIISTRFKMSNVNFEKKWECGHTKPESVTGSNDFFSEEQITEYYCETCTCTHIFIGEWQDLQKVCVRVKASIRDISNNCGEPSAPASLTGFTNEEINFTKMGIIVLNILADASYDLLKQDKPNLRPRRECDITNLYSEHRNLNKHIPSNSWGGSWQRIQNTDLAIGDDIERIRLTRNELQHSRIFHLDDTRFNELCNILSDLLKRFDNHNKPAILYTDQLNKILAKTVSAEEVKLIKNEIFGMTIEVDFEHQVNLPAQ